MKTFLKTLKDKEHFTLPSSAQADSVHVMIEENAAVTLLDEQSEPGERQIRIEVQPGGRLKWVSYIHAGGLWSDEKTLHLEKEAWVEFSHHILGGEVKEKVEVWLQGEQSSIESQILFFGYNENHLRLDYTHVHHGRLTRSLLRSKGAVKDSSEGHFFGKLRMLPGCSGAEGKLEEHNLLLSKDAHIEAVPALEIEHNEVKAFHSATLERVDEEKLFYLISRGLSESEAIFLLVEGFYKDALAHCQNPRLSARIYRDLLAQLV